MINTHTIRIDPKKIKLLDLNARYMRHEVFARLVDNIKEDGGLVGDTPFAWRVHDDSTQQPIDREGQPVYEVLSGNHRVKASSVAGIAEIELCVTDDYLPPDKRAAIQLSRNAISGEDDPATLKIIYENIADTALKLYTGLDDKQLKLFDEVATSSLSEANLTFQTISMTFLPHEIEQVEKVLTDARQSFPSKGYWLARWADYDRMLDALEQAGQAYNIKNTATTLMLILDIFMRHRDELAEGWLDAEGEPRSKTQRVPTVSIFNSDTVSGATASKLRKLLPKFDPDPLVAFDKLIDLAQSHLKMSKPDPKKQAEIARRRQIVSANVLAGATYREIAKQVNVSPATIANDLKHILAEWRQHYVTQADRYIHIQMRRYDVMLNAMWDEARNGKPHAIDRVLVIMDRQNALMGVTKGELDRAPAANIQIIEITKNVMALEG